MKLNKKGIIALRKIISVILALPGVFIMLLILTAVYNAYSGPPDQNIASVDIIIGEVETTISYMERDCGSRCSKEYVAVFPFALAPTHAIKAYVSDDRTKTQFVLQDKSNNWDTVHKQYLKNVEFVFSDVGEGPNKWLETKTPTLDNYQLRVKSKGSGQYIAEMKYCPDGWCAGRTGASAHGLTFDELSIESVLAKRIDDVRIKDHLNGDHLFSLDIERQIDAAFDKESICIFRISDDLPHVYGGRDCPDPQDYNPNEDIIKVSEVYNQRYFINNQEYAYINEYDLITGEHNEK